jgi:predicted transcriptional regulator
MKLREIVENARLTVHTGADQLDREVTGGYASDLLSDVVANGGRGDIWVTLQTHENTVAVASLLDLAGIVLVGGRRPDDETIRRAEREGIPILMSPWRTFEVVGHLIKAAVRERAEQ